MAAVEMIRDAYNRLLCKHAFKPGDLVQWKEGLKNRRIPKIRQPGIVCEVLQTSILDTEKDPGSPYFREPLDLVVGFFDEEEKIFTLFYFDSRRFEPYVQMTER